MPETSPRDDHDWNCIVPFLDDSLAFAQGVEIGMLFQRMKSERRITDYCHVENQEQITLMANRLGWNILSMKPWKAVPGQWFFLKMEKR